MFLFIFYLKLVLNKNIKLALNKNMKKNISISKKNNILFGLIFSIFFFVIAFRPIMIRERLDIRFLFIFISLLFLIVTIIRPNLFTHLNRSWIKFGILLGKIISPIFMSLVFFLVVTPIGIFLRILNKDVMGLKRRVSSYWINREDKIKSMKKQF
jgi:cell division protein FtsW (lipid II flippase)